MTKILKNVFVLFLAACLMITGIGFTACTKDDDPSKDGYTVTVLYPDGTPVKSTDSGDTRRQVSVTLLGSDGEQLKGEDGTPLGYVRLNNVGQAHFDYFVPGEYTISILNIPAGYTYDESAKTSAKTATVTVNLQQLRDIEYEINILLPDGSPAENIGVKLMKGRDTVASMTTGTDGKAKSDKIDAESYDVILNLPSSYCYKPVQTLKSGEPTTVQLYELHDVDLKAEDRMPDEMVKEWAERLNFGNYVRFNPDYTHYLYTAEMKGNEEIFFALSVEKAGTYSITVNNDPNYEMKFYPGSLASYEDTLTLKTNYGTGVQHLSLKPGEIFYISVCSLDGNAHTTQFAIAFNVDPVTVNATAPGTYTLNYELDYAILEFTPTVSGIYSIETNTDKYDTKLVSYSRATGRPILGEDGEEVGNDDQSATDKNCYFEEEVRQDHLGSTYIFRIYIKDSGVKFPVSISAIITRVGDAKTLTTNTVPVTTSNTTKFADQEGTYTEAPYDGTAETYEQDGVWYIKTPDGDRKLVASITRRLIGVEYSFATIEYMGESRPSEGTPGSGDDETINDVPVNNKLTLFVDEVITDTTITRNYKNYRGFIESYKTLCNKDGVYEVNTEIKEFLVHYLDRTVGGIDIARYAGVDVAEGCYWLLACGYYA